MRGKSIIGLRQLAALVAATASRGGLEITQVWQDEADHVTPEQIDAVRADDTHWSAIPRELTARTAVSAASIPTARQQAAQDKRDRKAAKRLAKGKL